jgi:DNA invertase Pin-like site-specific DNA recombinase
MLAFVRDHPEIGTLVVTSLDRLGRNVIDIQRNYIYLTKELGVGVVIVDFGGKVFAQEQNSGPYIRKHLSKPWHLSRPALL